MLNYKKMKVADLKMAATKMKIEFNPEMSGVELVPVVEAFVEANPEAEKALEIKEEIKTKTYIVTERAGAQYVSFDGKMAFGKYGETVKSKTIGHRYGFKEVEDNSLDAAPSTGKENL